MIPSLVDKYGVRHIRVVTSTRLLASCFFRCGRFDQCQQLLTELLPHVVSTYGARHRYVVEIRTSIAEAEAALSRPPQITPAVADPAALAPGAANAKPATRVAVIAPTSSQQDEGKKQQRSTAVRSDGDYAARADAGITDINNNSVTAESTAGRHHQNPDGWQQQQQQDRPPKGVRDADGAARPSGGPPPPIVGGPRPMDELHAIQCFMDLTTEPSTEPPEVFCFSRVAEPPTFATAVEALLMWDALPPKRPDVRRATPECLTAFYVTVNDLYEEYYHHRPGFREMLRDHLETMPVEAAASSSPLLPPSAEQYAKALIAYTLERPFPLYKWLNAWLCESRRDDDVVRHVGPFFVLLYRAMERLPRVRSSGHRAVIVPESHDSSSLFRRMTSDPDVELRAGRRLNFWSFASFSERSDTIKTFLKGASPVSPGVHFVCPDLEGASLALFSRHASEAEIQPLPPSSFEVQAFTRYTREDDGATVLVVTLRHEVRRFFYVHPRPPAT